MAALPDTSFSCESFCFSWAGNEYKVKFASIFALSLAVGLVGGIYGVGGGAIMSPFLISFFNLPVYVIAGATLLATFDLGSGRYLFQSAGDVFPKSSPTDAWRCIGPGRHDWYVYLGAASQRFMPARFIRYFARCSCFVSGNPLFVKAVFEVP